MRIADAVYFSPRFKFSELDLDDTGKLIEALRDRLNGFYLEPAARLLKTKDAFAAGILCCTAVDFVALCAEAEHPSEWLCKNIPEFRNDNGLSENFWNWFRHGLIHEGRIKSFGQFSLDFDELLTNVGPALVVNPRALLNAIQRSFESYFENLDRRQAYLLTKRLTKYFRAEIQAAMT